MVLQEITIVSPQGVDWSGKCLEFAREVEFLLCFGTREGMGKLKWLDDRRVWLLDAQPNL